MMLWTVQSSIGLPNKLQTWIATANEDSPGIPQLIAKTLR